MYKLILIVFVLWSSVAVAQVPVIEAGTSSRSQNNAPAAATSGGGNELIVTIYNQLEALQQEVQTLRGRVEEQDYQIKRMQTEQRDRYLDIDRRLSSGIQSAAPVAAPSIATGTPPPAVSSTGPAPTTGSIPPSVRNNAPANTSTPGVAANAIPSQSPQIALPVAPAVTPSTTATAPAGQMDEQELYRTALNLLLEQSNYEQSIQYFQTYVNSYPKGRNLTNSYYWQGEAFIPVGKFAEARDVFSKIINEFSQDPKAASAMLKLGVAYQEMGEMEQARKTWQEIAVRYPESTTEIREAANHLRGQ